jgi:fructose-specific phosphotransferase system IIC component
VLVLEGIAVLFVPRGIAQTDEGLSGGLLAALLVLAVVLILASGIQRRSRGLAIGTALQIPLLATGFINGVMWFVAGAFLLIWAYLLQVRKELIGTAFGDVEAPDRTDGGDDATATP